MGTNRVHRLRLPARHSSVLTEPFEFRGTISTRRGDDGMRQRIRKGAVLGRIEDDRSGKAPWLRGGMEISG